MVEVARFAFSSCLFLCHEVLEHNPGSRSISDNLDQHPLPTTAVELAVKDLLPETKVEPSVCDRYDDLPAHHLPLEVGVANLSLGPGQASSSVRLWR
jgi:hypothetical protein